MKKKGAFTEEGTCRAQGGRKERQKGGASPLSTSKNYALSESGASPGDSGDVEGTTKRKKGKVKAYLFRSGKKKGILSSKKRQSCTASVSPRRETVCGPKNPFIMNLISPKKRGQDFHSTEESELRSLRYRREESALQGEERKKACFSPPSRKRRDGGLAVLGVYLEEGSPPSAGAFLTRKRKTKDRKNDQKKNGGCVNLYLLSCAKKRGAGVESGPMS